MPLTVWDAVCSRMLLDYIAIYEDPKKFYTQNLHIFSRTIRPFNKKLKFSFNIWKLHPSVWSGWGSTLFQTLFRCSFRCVFLELYQPFPGFSDTLHMYITVKWCTWSKCYFFICILFFFSECVWKQAAVQKRSRLIFRNHQLLVHQLLEISLSWSRKIYSGLMYLALLLISFLNNVLLRANNFIL